MLTAELFSLRFVFLMLSLSCSYAKEKTVKQNVTIPSFEIIITRTKNTIKRNKTSPSSKDVNKEDFLLLIEKNVKHILEQEILSSQKNNVNGSTSSLEVDLSLFYDSSPLIRRRKLHENTQRKALMNVTKLMELMEEEISKLNQDEKYNHSNSTNAQHMIMKKEEERLSIIKSKDTIQSAYKFHGHLIINYSATLLLPFINSDSISNILSNAFYDYNLPIIIKSELSRMHNVSNIVSITYKESTKTTTREEFFKKNMQKEAFTIHSENIMMLTLSSILGGMVVIVSTSFIYNKLKSNIENNNNKGGEGRIGIGAKEIECDISATTKRSNSCFDMTNVSYMSYDSDSSSSSSMSSSSRL